MDELEKPLYTAEDMEKPVDTTTGNYPIAKGIAVAATGTQDIPDEIQFNKFVDNVWRTTVEDSNSMDYVTATNAASRGQVSVLEEATRNIKARTALYNEAAYDNALIVHGKLLELSERAAENTALRNPAVLFNNTTEEIGSATSNIGKRLAAQASVERAIEDGKKFSTIAAGLGFEITPFAAEQGPAIDDVAIKYGAPSDRISRATGRSLTKSYLQAKFKSLPEDEKWEWADALHRDLKDSLSISDWQAAILIQEVVTDEQQTWNGLSDWLDRLGVVGTVVSGGAAVFKASKLLKGANELVNVERTIAAAGGKSAIVSAEAAKIVSQAAAKQRLAAAGAIAGEVTGISAAIDLGKLVTMNAAKVLPDAITTAADDLQRVIREPVERLINELQDTVAAKGIRSTEAAAELEELNRIYSRANNPLIHSVDPFQLTADGTTILGKVLYKPENASAYLTKEAADAALATLDPTGKLGMKVVPDTTNTGFLVEEGVVRDLQLRKTALEAQILEAIADASKKTKRGSKAKTATLPTDVVEIPKPPKALRHSKPAWRGGVPLVFESDIDKAAYQVGSKTGGSKSDPEIKKWLQDATGWTDDEIKSHAASVRAYIGKNADMSVDDAGNILVANQVPASKPSVMTSANTAAYRAKHLADTTGLTSVGNLHMSTNVSQKDIMTFVSKLGDALGMGGRRVIVLELDDMASSANPLHQTLYNDMLTKHVSAGAVHYDYGDTSVIVMKKGYGGGMSRRVYMETFAHEYAHAFEVQWGTQYFGIMNSSFNKWLRAKGIKFQGDGINKRVMERFPLEALLEYRAITQAEQLTDWVNRYVAGDLREYYLLEDAMHNWATSYSEFFAENFAKWAFTNEVPKDILGQYFAGLVNGFKQIAKAVTDLLKEAGIVGVEIGIADKNITAMLNKHVKLVQQQAVDVKASMGVLASESKKLKPSVESLQKELAAIDDELRAISDASTGLKTGWLLEKPIERKLDYSVITKYTDEDINSATRFSLGDWALSTSSELYAQRVVGINQQSRYVKLLTNFVRPSVEKLNKAEMVALNDALVLGDKEGKVFSPSELAGSGLSKNAREAYYKVRALRDVMHQMRNDVAAKSLTRRGYVQLNTGLKLDDGGNSFFGKQTTPTDGSFVYVVDDNTTSRVSQSFMDEANTRGLVFYEAVEPILIDGKYRKVFAFSDGSYSSAKIEEAIPYRAGEYRRVYSDEYFVKITSEYDVDGALQTVTSTHRTAASVGDANAYVKAFNEGVDLHKAGKLTLTEAARLMQPYGWQPEEFIKALDSNQYGNSFKVEVKYNRTDDDYVNEMIGLSHNFSSKRGDKVLSVHGEDAVNTLSPLDSIASEIGNTAYVASVTEWRESHVVRWFNSFAEDLPANVRNMRPEEAFRYMLNNKGHYVGQSKRLQLAEKVQEYIIAQMNIPTKEEKEYLGFMRLISESIETKVGGKAAANVGMALRATKDYPTWARTIAFHSFFAFNPVQFFMQGMNAFNAVAISPLHGLRSAKSSTMYAMALMSDQEDIWRNFAKANKFTNMGLGMDEDEFVEVVRAVRRSGLLDGINSTSLYGAETGKYGLFNGVSRRVGSVAASPFNAGEGYSRLVSFDIARREFMDANKGVAWWTDDALAKIIERQDDLTQNMTRANVASWQQGWKSIPAQFVQYQVKLMMNVIQSILGNSRVFTQQEALRLLVTHTLVMGTAGSFLWPFRDMLTEMLPEDMSETQRLTIQQGVVAGMIATITDGEAKLAIGSRFNTFKYYEDLIKGLLDPEKSFMEIAAGPSGFAALRILGGVGEAMSIVVKAPMTQETLQIALTEIGRSSFSAINNVQKARIAMANYNQVQSNAGKSMYRVTDTEAWMIGFGIPPAAQEDLAIMYSSSKAHKKAIADDAKLVSKHAMLALTALRNNDTESHKTHAAVVQAILNSHSGADLQQLMREAYSNEAFTQYEKLVTDQAMKDWTVKDLTVKDN